MSDTDSTVTSCGEDDGSSVDEDEDEEYVAEFRYAPQLLKHQWMYSAFSERGESYIGSSGGRSSSMREGFKLLYNPADKELFNQTKARMKRAVELMQNKVFGRQETSGQQLIVLN